MADTKGEMQEGSFADGPEGILLADGFEDAFIGLCERFGGMYVAAYDYEKCIKKLLTDGMAYDEAIDYFEFNTIGSWVGEKTPVFIHAMTLKEYEEEIGFPRTDSQQT